MQDESTTAVQMTGFMIGDRPHVFVRDPAANERFLRAIDADFWAYQARVHSAQLASDDEADRQKAAAALRLAYGHGLETLFALVGGLLQCPQYPLAWLMRYTNADLRSVVGAIHRSQAFPNALAERPSWRTVAEAVLAIAPDAIRDELVVRYSALWQRFAADFLDARFEPEYNSLKHGMRPSVGGFSVAAGLEQSPGEAPAEMTPVGGSNYGSTFWLGARRLDGSRYTFELSSNVTVGWAPQKFVAALPLIGMSIRNVASRALVLARQGQDAVNLSWPSEMNQFDAPWQHAPSISSMAFEHRTELPGWKEPDGDAILRAYTRQNRPAGSEARRRDAADEPPPA